MKKIALIIAAMTLTACATSPSIAPYKVTATGLPERI
jgi:uncharacterized lipoprotein YmbA